MASSSCHTTTPLDESTTVDKYQEDDTEGEGEGEDEEKEEDGEDEGEDIVSLQDDNNDNDFSSEFSLICSPTLLTGSLNLFTQPLLHPQALTFKLLDHRSHAASVCHRRP